MLKKGKGEIMERGKILLNKDIKSSGMQIFLVQAFIVIFGALFF